MKCFRLISIALFLGMMWFHAAAQDSAGVEVQRQLEEAFEELDLEDTESNGEQLTQFLEDLAANPVNLNSAGIEDLLQIPGCNLLAARAIIDYRNDKPFETRRELLKVRGIGSATYQRMQPYITVGGTAERFRDMYTRPEYWLSGRRIEMISRYQQNLQEQEGFRRPDSLGGYVGSPVKYYQRLRIQTNHLSVNLTQEKDAGESLTGPADFDYNSFHLALTENGKLKTLVIGDYSLSFGQGLVVWTGGAFGKGREVTGTISKNERGLRPYSSAQETDFFRGAAVSYGEKIEVTAFYSDRERTASVLQGDTTRFPSSSGFHRTQNELNRRNNITQQTFGGRIRTDTHFGLFGVTGYHTAFSSYIGTGNSPSDLYDFTGTRNSVIGADYRALIRSTLVFGEAARSENGGFGAIVGTESPIGFDTEIALAYRNYQKDFQSFMGTGFGESSGDPNNEEGFYIGIRHQVNNRYRFSTYFDHYNFEAPRTGTTQRTQGYDVLSLIEAEFTDELNAYLLIRNEIKDDEYIIVSENGREERLLGDEKRVSARLHTDYQLSRQVRLRTRGEVVRYQSPGTNWETGMLLYQDVRLSLSSKLQVDARITFFDTDSFDTRVYQFENDLLYVLSNVALSERGQRAYFVLKYEALDYLQMWLKYSLTTIEDAHTLSSGLNEIKGNKRSFIGLQVRILVR